MAPDRTQMVMMMMLMINVDVVQDDDDAEVGGDHCINTIIDEFILGVFTTGDPRIHIPVTEVVVNHYV